MSDKMRDEFEVFYEQYMIDEGRGVEHIKNELASFTPERNKYGYSDAQEFWVIWQASRAALVVDLPSMTNNGYEGFYRESEVKRVMRYAGVSYK